MVVATKETVTHWRSGGTACCSGRFRVETAYDSWNILEGLMRGGLWLHSFNL